MFVTVKDFTGLFWSVIMINPDDRTERLVEKVVEVFRREYRMTVLADDITLIFRRKALEDGRTMSDVNVTADCTIHLIVARTCGCWTFNIKSALPKMYPIQSERGLKRVEEIFGKPYTDLVNIPPHNVDSTSWLRFVVEIVDLYQNEDTNVVKHIVSFDPREIPWVITLRAPEDSVYRGADVVFRFVGRKNYPMREPMLVQPVTKLLHPWRTDEELLTRGGCRNKCMIFDSRRWSPLVFLRDMIGFLLIGMRDVYDISAEKKFPGNSKVIRLMKKYGKDVFERVARIHTYCNFLDEEQKKERIVDIDLEERASFICSFSEKEGNFVIKMGLERCILYKTFLVNF